ncbi:hypothetical protein FB451DRAFT_1188231 [Mycena latifolia]|nr:hypothetical protein FB451DRAFT_1188231 [Mycena latifolia]
MSSTSAFHAIVFSPSFRMYTTRVFPMATAMLIGSLTMLILSSTEALNIPTVWIALITNLCIIGHLIFIRRCCGPQLLEALLSYTSSCNIIPTSGRGPLWSVPSMRNTGITGTPIQAEVRFLWRLPSQPQSEEFLLGTSRPNGEAVDQVMGPTAAAHIVIGVDLPFGPALNGTAINVTGWATGPLYEPCLVSNWPNRSVSSYKVECPQSGNWDKYNGVSVSLNFSQFSTNESTLAYVYVGEGDLNGSIGHIDPITLVPGSHILVSLTFNLRTVFSHSLAGLLGFSSGSQALVINKVNMAQQDPSPPDAGPQTASLRLIRLYREPSELLEEYDDTSVITGISFVGGFWTVVNSVVVFLFGADAIYFLFTSAQLPRGRRMPTCMGNIGDSSDKERKGH